MTKAQGEFADYLITVTFNDCLADGTFFPDSSKYTLAEAEMLLDLYDEFDEDNIYKDVKRSKAFVKTLAKMMDDFYIKNYNY